MRRAFILLAVIAAAGALTGASAGARSGRVAAGHGLTVVLPSGWHLVNRSLTDVRDPAQRLAVATFPAHPASHLCSCGFPNLRGFPRAGAFVFVWEYLSNGNLHRIPPRPRRFSLAGAPATTQMCLGPSATFAFRAAGHAYQVEIYLGRAAGPRLRRQAQALLDSLRIA